MLLFSWWAVPLGVSAAAVLVILLSAWLAAWPDEPKPNQWQRYRGVMQLRQDFEDRREPVLSTADFAKCLRSKPTKHETER